MLRHTPALRHEVQEQALNEAIVPDTPASLRGVVPRLGLSEKWAVRPRQKTTDPLPGHALARQTMINRPRMQLQCSVEQVRVHLRTFALNPLSFLRFSRPSAAFIDDSAGFIVKTLRKRSPYPAFGPSLH